jgi:hypothetical protein
VVFNITDELLIIYCIRQILDEKWEYNGMVHQVFIDFRKACGSFRRKVLNLVYQ